MNQKNNENSGEIKSENSPKLLKKKTIRFKVDKESNSNNSKFQKYQVEGRWSYAEQIKFIKALSNYGPNWKKIQETINFRTLPQVRSHGQKFFKKLKRCKDVELGIDFTTKSIRSFKDMINHIKSVNSNYDINNVFLYLYGYKQKSTDVYKENDDSNKDKINISNTGFQILTEDNKKSDLNNMNNIQLQDSLNNINNTFNSYFLNCLTKSLMTSDLINRLFNDYLKNINTAISNASQSSFISKEIL